MYTCAYIILFYAHNNIYVAMYVYTHIYITYIHIYIMYIHLHITKHEKARYSQVHITRDTSVCLVAFW